MKTTMEKSDTEIKSDVLSELAFEPSVNVTDIGVLVKDGAVTLNGYARSYGEKWNAVRAAKRVGGVTAIADDIEVKLPESLRRTDGDIAAAAVNQINCSTSIPKGTVGITVRDGWITLEGQLEWWYQKNDAQYAIQHLWGVTGVSNLITIKPKLKPSAVDSAIERAFDRNAFLDAERIEVKTSGGKVTLSGKVRNYAEREEAERVAWAVPGVSTVDNQLNVEWSCSLAG